ncbi:MAG: hypothetical protein ACYTBS_18275 [Planctomycetota bacterium]|jgi:hypothetical protein
MASCAETTQAVIDALRKKKILTLEEISAISQWSRMTLWRHLKPVGYYTSFNFNARYYTLAETPYFDENGLWFYRTVGFSSAGSLTRTIVALVDNSPMGLTANELSALLTVRVQNHASELARLQKLDRVAWGRAQLYLSHDEVVRTDQRRARERYREDALLVDGGHPLLTENETIEILAQLLRTPRLSARRVAIVLSARGLTITRAKVLTVIEKYELRKKGRLRRSRRSTS